MEGWDLKDDSQRSSAEERCEESPRGLLLEPPTRSPTRADEEPLGGDFLNIFDDTEEPLGGRDSRVDATRYYIS